MREGAPLEELIEQWRGYVQRRQAIHAVDVAELEDHLRQQIDALMEDALAADEAFLIAVKRMGDLDSLSREFAREHADRLWKQLVVAGAGGTIEPRVAHRDITVAFCLAAAAAIAVKLPLLFGIHLATHEAFYARNAGFFVMPFVAAYFAWKRRLDTATVRMVAVMFSVAVIAANIYPLAEDGSTEALTMLHMPVALWLIVGVAYSGGRWREFDGRMDFIRFSGEFFTYAVLVGFGSVVLTTISKTIFNSIGVDASSFIQWLVPCAGAAAFVIIAWLVEAKQSVIENMAPVMTRLFTPVLVVVLITFLAVLLLAGRGLNVERGMLTNFNILLVLVLALLVYSVSARDRNSPPGAFDALQVVLLVGALFSGAVALWAISVRIASSGITPERVALLGINVILLANIGRSVVLYVHFLRGRGSFASLERWQTDYLTVYAVWTAIVVMIFPIVFGFN